MWYHADQRLFITPLRYDSPVPRPKTHDDALRVRLLDRAGELLSTEGPGALSLRRLAADVNTSTTAVYSLFGGKPALLDALYEEGFRRYEQRLASVPGTDDPVEDITRIGRAYREHALADPHFYLVMFSSRSTLDFQPSAGVAELARGTFQPVLGAVERAVRDGVFVDEEPGQLALALWGLVHGLISLELNAALPAGLAVGAVYERAVRAQCEGWRRR
ncbi:transcriptional regulator, TetR family [Actinosynnema mirum DSM 43827]|uniref:Transcriptional regulator, TetR family n=2 Tax=Actinosynnema TaxID=40566 RepID=C6WKH8_ACTMD|nr:transcriptional regulator, TetR family [Actinosynnema mirum DSM 43827]ATE57275.1 TetR/AcrR family transcriptional regulator [Actinosynnema pretiosum]